MMLIDGNTLLFKNFHLHTTKNIYNVNNPTLVGFLRSINKYKKLYNVENDNIIITFDKGKSKYRKRLLKTYKQQRVKDRKKNNFNWDLYVKHFNDIINVIKYLYRIIIINNYEGDDIIAYYTINNNNHDIIIISNDKDLLQLLYNDNIIFHNIYNNNIITCYNYKYYTNYDNYNHYLMFKILNGDKSDNINKINNNNDINIIIRKYDNIDNYLKFLKDVNINEYYKVKLNRMLVDLYYFQSKFGKYLKQKITKEENKFKYNPHEAIKNYMQVNDVKHINILEELL